MKESKQLVQKVRNDFDATIEYSVSVAGCSEELKMQVQQAFFNVGFYWEGIGDQYGYLDAAQYTNAASDGEVDTYLMYSNVTDECNMTAKQFLQLVYEPSDQDHVQAELKNMKLIDLLISNDIQWPVGAKGVVQDSDGEIKFYAGEKPTIDDNEGIWIKDIDHSSVYLGEVASDCCSAIITKTDWENRKVDKKAMFDGVKVGDKVWDICQGWSVVNALLEGHAYTICVGFEHGDSTYTMDGYSDLEHVNPSLYWDEIKIEPPQKPLPLLEVDTKVVVQLPNNGIKICRHFSHFDEYGFLYVFIDGRTSFTSDGTTHRYDNWELAQ